MKLLTKEILDAFAKQGDTSSKQSKDIPCILKLFNPCGAATWFLYEYDPKDRVFFGYANLGDDDCAELGSVSLDELESLTLPMGLKIERDIMFQIGKYNMQEIIDKKGHV
jgi:hypothetical protein